MLQWSPTGKRLAAALGREPTQIPSGARFTPRRSTPAEPLAGSAIPAAAVDLGDRAAGTRERARPCGPAWTASSAPWTWRPIGIRAGSRPSAAARRLRFHHGGIVVVGEDAEVEAVEGRLADPAEPGREGRASPRPGRPRSHRTPSLSRHSIVAAPLAGRRQRRRELLLAAGDLAVELGPQRRLRGRARAPAPSGTPAAIRSVPSISSVTSLHSLR